jgi:hypothetical protein
VISEPAARSFDGARDEYLSRLCLLGNAGSNRNGDSARLLPHELALPGVKTGTDLEPERAHAIDRRERALDRTARAIESGEEAVPRGVDLVTVELA